MESGRERLTIGRDYCRGCERPSRQRFAGYATADGHENSCRPRAFYRKCDECGTPRLVLGGPEKPHVNDAEGLCRSVLAKWLRQHATDAAVGATDRPFGDGMLDADDALAFLQTEVWLLYTRWEPERSAGSFLAYASELLPRRLATWSRDASGEASERSKGRRFPKAHAASVSTSFDGILEGGGGDGEEERGGSTGLADPRLGRFSADHAETLSPDLLRALTAGSRGAARDRGRDGVTAPPRPPAASV